MPIALGGLALIAVLALLTWIASLVQRDASLVDRMWSLMIAGPAIVYALQTSWTSLRAIAMLALVVAWGARLAAYITWRNWGHGEDRRYQEIRARNEPGFAFKSLYLIFALQMVLAWIVSSATLAALAGDAAFGCSTWSASPWRWSASCSRRSATRRWPRSRPTRPTRAR